MPQPASNATILTTEAEFKGACAFDGELQLNGRFEGTIESEDGHLIIGDEALVKAEINVREVIVYGKLQGNITASEKIELRGKAQIYGDIRSNRIHIEDGVVFVGHSELLTTKTESKPDFTSIFSKLGADRSAKHQTSPATNGRATEPTAIEATVEKSEA